AVLDDRQRLDGIDAQVREIFDAVQHVEELGHAAFAIRPGVGTDVELVDDEIAELRWPPAPVLPREGAGGAQDAIGVRPYSGELPGIRVALEALVALALSDDEEFVSFAFARRGDKPRPPAIDDPDQERGLVFRPLVEVPADIDLARTRRPNA